MATAASTPWYLTPDALSAIARAEYRLDTELVRDLLSPSGSSRLCYVGPGVDALDAVFAQSDDAKLGDCGARGVPLPEAILAALFGPADPSRVFADDWAKWANLKAEIDAALALRADAFREAA